MKRLLLFLLLCAPCWADNLAGFQADANCVALYRCEPGALDVDTINGQTLGVTHFNPASDANRYQEGSGSVLFTDDAQSIVDSSLVAGFPGKSGTSNTTFSLCYWVRYDTVPSGTGDMAVSKWSSGTNARSFASGVDTSAVVMWIGYNGGASTDAYHHGSTIATDIWYHVGVTWNGADNAYRIRVYDANATAILGTDLTGTGGNAMSPDSANFMMGDQVGLSQEMYGNVDELVVFNDVLTSNEIDLIRQGLYGSAESAITYPKQHPIGRGSNQGIGAGL